MTAAARRWPGSPSVMKTVRFAQVVAKAGQPEPYTLWTDPGKDADFKTALKENRVLTVHEENVGTKKDYGTVGFTRQKWRQGKGSLLVFPKSLKSFEARRVIGINYDLLESAKPAKPRAKAKPTEAKRSKTAAPAKPGKKHRTRKPQPEPVIHGPGHRKEFGPLRIFKPAEEKIESQGEKRSTAKEPSSTKATSTGTAEFKALQREVRKAIKLLEQGKAVAAHQTLRKALD